MKKKIVSGVMALSLVFCSAAALPEGAVTDLLGSGITASADDELTSGFWRFTKDKDNYAYVTGYTGFDSKITIPPTLEELPVVGIAGNAFENNQNLSEVVIPSNVTYIGYRAFAGSSITKITVPATVKTIAMRWGDWGSCQTFKDCTKLKSVVFNAGDINEELFSGCTALTTVKLGSSTKSISSSAFLNCSSLSSINLNNVTSINSEAFAGCNALKSVTLGNNLGFLGYRAFAESGLTSVTVPAKAQIGLRWGDWGSASTFSGCEKLTTATINNKYVGEYEFEKCPALKTVTLGTNIRSIDSNSFSGNKMLTTVINKGNPVYIGANAFSNCTSLKNINLGSSLAFLGYAAFSGDTSLTTMRIPSTVVSLGLRWGDYGSASTFEGCTNLKNVYIASTPMSNDCGMFDDSTGVVVNTVKDSPAYKYATNKVLSKKTFAAKPAKSIAFNSKNYTVVVNDSINLYPTISPANSTDSISYVSGDESVATVDMYGTVTAKKTGPVQIKVTTSSGKNAVCTINVVASGTTSKDTPKKKSVKPVSVSLTTQTYTGKALKPSPTVLLNPCTQLVKGVDYTVSYKNNKKVGKATITITGKGNYTGSVSKTFSINPKSTSVSKLTNQKGKKAKVTYKKVAGVTGYQVTYSTSKKFTKSTTKNVNVKGAAKTSKVLKKLKKNKTYYVKVRSYQKVSGTTYYSTYSKVKKVKIKK
ncbi:MAG: leucine-rich repeat protein [Ruminococcus sp.]|nr:leucine-rich repeat protein [Ruminococcus sp.]